MTVHAFYAYLVRARHDLWSTLVAGDVAWHVMLHEVRHTAQIVAFRRSEGVRPPALDLLYDLPLRS